ncbi:MAG: 2,3-bisphosphoglycerate-independent phosphoglycerate mutase [Candidatus Rokuibacteriota bacterium]|nr:MAG: 2,3-bisphosphoglycerate-independent phosphoglycerate mutase [Candidatus Rokubacteria bacterium]
MRTPLVLIVRDGWGIRDEIEGNAVRLARTPVVDRLLATYPASRLKAAGTAVGTREGIPGSSEVGHLNMGAGRVVEQEILRVDKLIASPGFYANPKLCAALDHCAAHGSRLHLMGLVQDQGVHATLDHCEALLGFCAHHGFRRVFVHVFADGRDSPPQSALGYLDRLERKFVELGLGRVASVMGRFYAMDRDRRWERTTRAWDALVHGVGLRAPSAREAIEAAYRRRLSESLPVAADSTVKDVETDEFIQPTLVTADGGAPLALIQAGDAVLHFNYRQDRAIQLTRAFVEERLEADGFARGPRLPVFYLGLTRYYDEFAGYIIPPMTMIQLLGEVLAQAGRWQLRLAESTKYRHVTSFFNGKRLAPFPREDRVQVRSLAVREDEAPEMRADAVTAVAEAAITEGIQATRALAGRTADVAVELDPGAPAAGARYDVIVMNYANPDMVGHTGSLPAAIRAVEVVDACVGRVVAAAHRAGGCALVTSDHGNVEQMLDPVTGAPQTAHTANDVEIILACPDLGGRALRPAGVLADVAPTMLDLLGLPIPPEMTAASLLRR